MRMACIAASLSEIAQGKWEGGALMLTLCSTAATALCNGYRRRQAIIIEIGDRAGPTDAARGCIVRACRLLRRVEGPQPQPGALRMCSAWTSAPHSQRAAAAHTALL